MVRLVKIGGSSLGPGDAVAAAKAYVEQVTTPNPPWDGPTSGPAAQPGKTIVYASADQRNGGALGVGLGVEEAAKLLGWDFHLIDGRASVSGRSEALNQAIALQPDGIVLGTIDANEQAAAIQAAADEGIVVVGWHATASSWAAAGSAVAASAAAPIASADVVALNIKKPPSFVVDGVGWTGS